MSFRDVMRKLIPIGRKEAREQYYLLNQKLEELQTQLKAQREWQEAVLQDHQHLMEKVLTEQLGQRFAEHQQWQEAVLLTPLSRAFAEQTAWASEALEAHRQWQEAALEVHREWQGSILCFLQSRLVRMEYLIQSNLLERSEQEKSQVFRFILRMRALFPLMSVEHPKPFVRMGGPHDGGYVMLDDFEDKKIAYSFGIADDVSWDTDIARRGMDVYMYDHTISCLPCDNDRFHFFPIGLCPDNTQARNLKSLSELMLQNGHSEEYGIILKIDIEGAEWDVLESIDEALLKHFSQIIFEFHGLILQENEEKMKNAMNKLNRTHQLAHIHANNYGGYLQLGGVILPELIEGTYLLRDEYSFIEKTQDVHWNVDSVNNPIALETVLGTWDT